MITLCTVHTEKRKYVSTTTDAKHKYQEYSPYKEHLDSPDSEHLRGYYAEQQRQYSTQRGKMMAYVPSAGQQAAYGYPHYEFEKLF